jgi:predicted dehydrogenase
MSNRVTRRAALKTAMSCLASGVWSARHGHAATRSAGNRLNIGLIGVGGHGIANLAKVEGENIAALCDVDSRSLGKTSAEFTKARTYRDFRKMLDQRDLEAVVISTPDHTHAVAAAMAMRRDLHVFCEKPLAHSVFEVRVLARLAKKAGVRTQMGNQDHASDGVRRAVEWVRSGAIGDVREVHVWTDRPLWPQGVDRPRDTPLVPDYLDWNLWLGPAPARPYHSIYHPFDWRGFWDFGTGAIGDMGCHLIDPAYWALELGSPLSITPESTPVGKETGPRSSRLTFVFAARGNRPAVTLTWYDGGRLPPTELAGVKRWPPNGTLIVGDGAKLFVPNRGRSCIVLPKTATIEQRDVAFRLPPTAGHHQEWIDACKTGGDTSSDFQYGAKLSEVCLLGNVALRVGEKIDWDAEKMAVPGHPDADEYLKREYRQGWSLENDR